MFGTFKTPARTGALAFTAYGVHWFAIGWNRLHQADPRVNVGMAFAFTLISILGIIVFFSAGDHPVGGVFIGLTCVYVADFFAGLGSALPGISAPAERALGFFRIGTALWLMYLTFAVALNFVLGYTLPVQLRRAGALRPRPDERVVLGCPDQQPSGLTSGASASRRHLRAASVVVALGHRPMTVMALGATGPRLDMAWWATRPKG